MPYKVELSIEQPSDLELEIEQPNEIELESNVIVTSGGEDIGLVVKDNKICVRYEKED